jgi:hypothetical protein
LKFELYGIKEFSLVILERVLIHYSSVQDEQLREEDGMSMNVSCKDECTEIKIITTITEDLIMEHEEVDTYANKTKGKFLELSLIQHFR